MIINQARCDYLTLTTFNQQAAIQNALSDLYPDEFADEVRKGGYSGLEWDGLFAGKGKQNGVNHYILRAYGEESETVFWRTADVDAKCTRIDLQITVRMPQFYSARSLFDRLIAKDTIWPGRRLKPRLQQSGDGLDTVYLGSRTSQRMFRIYIKPGQDGKPEYLRFEVEYKDKLAIAVREKIVSRETSMREIICADLHRLPYYTSRTLKMLDNILGRKGTDVKPEKAWNAASSFEWVQDQVEPTIQRLLLSHNDGGKMRKLLERWQRYAEDLDQYYSRPSDLDEDEDDS